MRTASETLESMQRWTVWGITHWLAEDLSVAIMKWTDQGHTIQIPKTGEKVTG